MAGLEGFLGTRRLRYGGVVRVGKNGRAEISVARERADRADFFDLDVNRQGYRRSLEGGGLGRRTGRVGLRAFSRGSLPEGDFFSDTRWAGISRSPQGEENREARL